MSRELSEVNIQKVSINEDLTDDEADDDDELQRSLRRSARRDPKPKGHDSDDASKRRKLRLRKMGQKAASLKFSALDFVALSPDKLKKHYTIGSIVHRGGTTTNNKLGRDRLHHTASTSSAASPRANIHECTHLASGHKRAVKVVKKSTRWNHRRNQRVRKEFQVLKALDHPSLVRVYEFFEGKDHYYIIMDLCQGGDLCQELDAWGTLEEEDAALLMKQLLAVLSYCHASQICHGNIKLEHVLLEHDKDLDHVKVTDFSCADMHNEKVDTSEDDTMGDDNKHHHKSDATASVESIFANEYDDDSDNDSTQQTPTSSTILPERLGTPDYWAPEVVLKGSTGTKRDIWACGVLCYLVLSNQFPFHGNSREEVCERIIRGEFRFPGGDEDCKEECEDGDNCDGYDNDMNYGHSFYSDYLDGEAPVPFSWKDVSENAKSFIKLLLTYEEDKRPTARQALKHPWIVENTKPAIQKSRQSGTRFSNTWSSSPLDASNHKNTNHKDEAFLNSMSTMAAWHNVAKFNAKSKLKQATLTFIAAQMVLKEERKAIDHIFRTLDIYKDGKLSRKEVQIGYRQVFERDLTEAELDDLFERVDISKTGYIEYSEFLVAAMNESDLLHREKIQQAFAVFDRDGSGTIDKEDLKGVLQHFKGGGGNVTQTPPSSKHRIKSDRLQDAIDDQVIDKILKQADSSGDGQITYEDFMAMMLQTTDDSEEDEGEEKEEEEADQEEDGEVAPLPKVLAKPNVVERKASLKRANTGSSIESAVSAEHVKTLRFTSHDFSVAKRPGELTDYYFIEDFIDEGGFGKVYVCKHKATNQERALKVINKSRWRKEDNKKVMNEYELLKELAHPNIIKFFDLFQDKSHFYIVMSICKGGDLCDELDAWGALSEANAAILMNQVLSCMNYIHAKKIIHRDMKPDNILLEQSKDFRQVKVIDFGLATKFEDGVEMKERAGTAQYMAPEVVARSYYGSKSDMWSVGVICYLVLSDKFPFNDKNAEKLYATIAAGNYFFPTTIWGSISEDAKAFVQHLLVVDPKERVTAEKALQHRWLGQARFKRASIALEESSKSEELRMIEAADDSTRYALTNLQNFKGSRLQEAVKTFIASQLLLEEEKKAIDNVFRDLDITSDGKLSKSEVRAAFFKFFGRSLKDEELESLFRRVGKGSDFIEYSDFVVATMNENVLLRQNKLRKAFDLFDDDGNGLISASDLKKAFTMFGQNEQFPFDDGSVKRLIKQVDQDGDGKISYDEFVGAMMLSADEELESGLI